jgi:hypothetical protein
VDQTNTRPGPTPTSQPGSKNVIAYFPASMLASRCRNCLDSNLFIQFLLIEVTKLIQQKDTSIGERQILCASKFSPWLSIPTPAWMEREACHRLFTIYLRGSQPTVPISDARRSSFSYKPRSLGFGFHNTFTHALQGPLYSGGPTDWNK